MAGCWVLNCAASLREVNVEVTIVQRISRLMDRQLDPLGSQLLHEELTDKGVDIYYNDEIERFLGDTTVNGVSIKKRFADRLPGIGYCYWNCT